MQSADPVGNSIDLVFLTYWLPPVKGAQLVLEKDVQCISDKLKKALGSKGECIYYLFIINIHLETIIGAVTCQNSF